jgi:hypothetical protein
VTPDLQDLRRGAAANHAAVVAVGRVAIATPSPRRQANTKAITGTQPSSAAFSAYLNFVAENQQRKSNAQRKNKKSGGKPSVALSAF